VRDSKPIELNEVSKAVSEAAVEQMRYSAFIKGLRFNMEGVIERRDGLEEEFIDDKNINYLESGDFENLNVKLYSLRELQNLLGSTDLYQRSFALQLLTNSLLKNPSITPYELFHILLNQELTHLLDRIL